MRRALRIPIPPILRRGVTAPRMHTQLRVFGGITGRVERPPLKYRLTRGPTERRIQLTSGSMVLTPAQAVIESLRKLKPQDRHIIAGVVKTKFARGGKIGKTMFSLPQLLKKIWGSFPGTVKILVN